MGLVRVYLAVCVVLIHCKLTLPFTAGHFAVEIFFIISGFYMALVLNEKYTEANPARFYLARYLRLWPTYIVVLLFATSFLRPFPAFPADLLTKVYFYFSTITLFGHDTMWFALPTPDGLALSTSVRTNHVLSSVSGMPHMWSVGVELTFYALAPLVARRWRAILVAFVLAVALHVWITVAFDRESPVVLRTPLNFFWLFLSGMLGYWVWRAVKPRLDAVPLPAILVAATAVVATGTLIYMRRHVNDDVLLVIFAVLLIPAYHYTRKAEWDRATGELSYPIYVVHYPLVVYFWPAGDVNMSLVVVALTAVASVALHLAVVRPIDSWRTRIPERIAKARSESAPAE